MSYPPADPITDKSYNQSTPRIDDLPAQHPADAANDPPSLPESGSIPVTHHLADRLARNNFHPVLIFGTTMAGKSSLLTSLFAYIRSQSEAAARVNIGEWLVPTESEYGERLYNEAQYFFHRVVNNFINQTPAPQTRSEFPFFIPVVFMPKEGTGLQSIKFAFLESKGEWYQPHDSQPGYFQDFREEIAEVLSKFPDGVSVVHVAPAVTRAQQNASAADSRRLSDEDMALLGVMTNYELKRRGKRMDQHLYLLTKWDRYAGIEEDEFKRPDVTRLRQLLNRSYNQSWTAFQSMDLGPDDKGRRHFMQYSSGLMDAEGVLSLADRDRPALDRYPRTLWNWLYGNATSAGGGPRRVLYADVMPPIPRKPTVMDVVMKTLGVR